MSEVLNLITNETSKEELLKEYETYPAIMPDGLEAYPFAGSRVLPIYYEIKDGSKVLDLGCNDGAFMQLLKEKKKCDVSGVDVSDVALEVAKKRGLNVQKADGESLPFEDETFDYVTLMEVLSHVHNPQNVLREAKRVLKKNGILLGSAPHANLERHIWDDKRKHHRYYETDQLFSELQKVFQNTYVRVLKGGQFALSFAHTFLASEPVEMLFKCGGKKTKKWEEALLDTSVLRCYMGFTTNGGQAYIRMRGFADKMRDQGHEIAYEDFQYSPEETQQQWQNRIMNKIVQNQLESLLRVADVSVWQIVSNRQCLAFLRCAKDVIKKPIIMEIDDWVFDLPSTNLAVNAYQPNAEPEWIAHEQLKVSDAFICSTQFIADNIKQLFPGKECFIIPNAIDFDLWDNVELPKDHGEKEKELLYKKEGVIRIGYTGCANHQRDVDVLVRPILKLLEEFENVEFVYAHPLDALDKLNHPRIKCFKRWVPINYYPNELFSWGIDIGVAPLRDNNFNRAKSNLRWLEYSALKVPTICSNIYPFKNSVKDGEDGLVCESEQEWFNALRSLVVDKERRIELGKRAYERVKRDFNMDEVAKKYASVLQEIKRCRQKKDIDSGLMKTGKD